jgi:hypothetical protein
LPRVRVRLDAGAPGRAAALRAEGAAAAAGADAGRTSWGSGAGEHVGERVARRLLRESIRQPALAPTPLRDGSRSPSDAGSGAASDAPAEDAGPAAHGWPSGGAAAAAAPRPGSASLKWQRAAARGRAASLGGGGPPGRPAGGPVARSMLRCSAREPDEGEHKTRLNALLGSIRSASGAPARAAAGGWGWRVLGGRGGSCALAAVAGFKPLSCASCRLV